MKNAEQKKELELTEVGRENSVKIKLQSERSWKLVVWIRALLSEKSREVHSFCTHPCRFSTYRLIGAGHLLPHTHTLRGNSHPCPPSVFSNSSIFKTSHLGTLVFLPRVFERRGKGNWELWRVGLDLGDASMIGERCCMTPDAVHSPSHEKARGPTGKHAEGAGKKMGVVSKKYQGELASRAIFSPLSRGEIKPTQPRWCLHRV